MEKKKYRVRFIWEKYIDMVVEASSKEEAIREAQENDFLVRKDLLEESSDERWDAEEIK